MTESTESIVPNAEPNVPHQELFIDESLQLKQLDLSQAERLFELTEQDRDYLSQWLPWPEHTKSIEDSREFIESMIAKRASGEARWALGVAEALKLETPSILAAFNVRLGSQNGEVNFATKLLAAMRNKFGGHTINKSSDE